MLSFGLFYFLCKRALVIALMVLLFFEVSRVPSPEIASVREQQWSLFEQRAQQIKSLDTQQSIEASAEQLLRSRPLDNRSLRLLAYVAEKRQNKQKAKLLMQLAFERSRADAVANAWLIEAHLVERNWDAALVHLSAAHRIYGPLHGVLLPAVQFVSLKPTDTLSPPRIVGDVLRTMGANRENNRCAAAVEGRPPRSKSDRPCSGPPALFVLAPLHIN